MRQIRILTCIASPDWCFNPGAVVRVGAEFKTDTEVPREAAEAWVAGGVIAEVVEESAEESAEETTTLPDAPEAAVSRRRTGGRNRKR